MQERYQDISPANLTFLEPTVLLKENPEIADAKTFQTELFFRDLIAHVSKSWQEDIQLPDLIPVSLPEFKSLLPFPNQICAVCSNQIDDDGDQKAPVQLSVLDRLRRALMHNLSVYVIIAGLGLFMCKTCS